MSDAVWLALFGLGAYLLGSIPWGLLLAKRRGVDVRQAGSGNIGATNVARTAGKKLGALVLLLDAFKGMIPMGVTLFLGLPGKTSPYILTVVGAAAIAGHCFPVWLRFRGGKGVATSLGVFAILDPVVAGIAAAAWIGLYAAFRVASIGSLAAAVLIPVLFWALERPPSSIALGAVAAAIVIAKHHGNIRRLLGRQELKV